MAYSKFHGSGWKNRPNFTTPITAEAMDHLEEGIAEAHRLAEAGGGSGGGSITVDPADPDYLVASGGGIAPDPTDPDYLTFA